VPHARFAWATQLKPIERNNVTITLRFSKAIAFAVAVLANASSASFADEVLDWNVSLQRALNTAATPGPIQGRAAAIVHVAMFDALNGIERRYESIHVNERAPRGASRRVAVVYAAYTTLVALFPTQVDDFNADLEASLAGIVAEPARRKGKSMRRGRVWGEHVAQHVLAWRSADGLSLAPSTYVGSTEVGKWRPTPRPGPGGTELPGLNGSFPSLATTLPFAIPSPSHFRPAGPPALTSSVYGADVNEVKLLGEATSATRTADQTDAVRFWAGTAFNFWQRAAANASAAHHLTLSQNARLFAQLNVAIADALIACWDSKYHFELWRPVHAIRLASTDGNDATVEQLGWVPFLVTPPYPEYYSGHQSNAGPAQAILTAYFGDDYALAGISESLPGAVRSFASFEAAADEASMSRIWGGIHFRFAMHDTRAVGEEIAAFVLENVAAPAR
jgi:hypothetical protein